MRIVSDLSECYGLAELTLVWAVSSPSWSHSSSLVSADGMTNNREGKARSSPDYASLAAFANDVILTAVKGSLVSIDMDNFVLLSLLAV
jgi:hypothetical protein